MGGALSGLGFFGSQAGGDAEPGSDIDVLVVPEGPVQPGAEIRRTLDPVAGLSLLNNVVFTCVFVSRKRFEVRLTGDYDSTLEVSVEEAAGQIANAEQFMPVARQRLGGLPPMKLEN